MLYRIYISRAINYYWFSGCPDEMLCGRVHRECWPVEPILDAVFFFHPQHCQRCYEFDRKKLAALQR